MIEMQNRIGLLEFFAVSNVMNRRRPFCNARAI